MYIIALLLYAIFFGSTTSNPIIPGKIYSVKESHFIPRGWTEGEDAPKDSIINLNIGIKQGNFEELERHLYEGIPVSLVETSWYPSNIQSLVSNPEHPRYGNHLSVDDVNNLVKPSKTSDELVHEWLADHGIDTITYSVGRDWLSVSLPVSAAERLLRTRYRIYQHEDGDRIVRTPEWSLPIHLHDHIDAIQPTTSFMRLKGQGTEYLHLEPWTSPSYTPPKNSDISAVCNVSSVTPQCFETIYSTKGYRPQAGKENGVGFTNYLGEIPIRPDTAKFLAKYRPCDVDAAAKFPQYSIADGPTQDGPLSIAQAAKGTSQEANLDVQAFIPDLNTPTNTNEPYLVWLNYILGQRLIPQVISTSYGDDEQTVPQAYAERVCKQFAQLGARGVSVLFASGDRGVGLNSTCYSNDGKNTKMFIPIFPGGCPYVTTVGATHEFEPEVVAFRPGTVRPDGSFREIYSSGGGFSNYFSTPAYQKDVVKDYVKGLGGLYNGLYNKAGRAYPDIAAQGQYFAYVWNGTEGVISGTSASTPLMAGILALVNDALLESGKSTLGFLNPWLYSKGYKGFTDIISGSAVGCQVEGFAAKKGWDPVTGFGTPVFPTLLKLAKRSAGYGD